MNVAPSISRLYKTLTLHRAGVLLFAAGFCIVLYFYAIESRLGWVISILGFAEFPGDLAHYVFRLVMATLFLGLLPAGLALVLGLRSSQIGLSVRWSFLRDRFFWICFVVVAIAAITSAFDPQIRAFYPFSRTIFEKAQADSAFWLVGHLLAYVFFYYLPWEILFRGVLLFPLFSPDFGSAERLLIPDKRVANQLTVFMVFPQAIVSTLLHVAHPMSETIGALVFGFVAARLVVRHRTILPALLIHAFAGVALDTVLFFT